MTDSIPSKERAAFEAWAESEGCDLTRDPAPYTNSENRYGDYREWRTQLRWEAWDARASRSANEPPAVPARVRLLKDIYDDGQDHHPPGYIAKRGEVVEVREARALAVAHEGITDSAFVVRAGEFEPVSAPPPSDELLRRLDEWFAAYMHDRHDHDEAAWLLARVRELRSTSTKEVR